MESPTWEFVLGGWMFDAGRVVALEVGAKVSFSPTFEFNLPAEKSVLVRAGVGTHYRAVRVLEVMHFREGWAADLGIRAIYSGFPHDAAQLRPGTVIRDVEFGMHINGLASTDLHAWEKWSKQDWEIVALYEIESPSSAVPKVKSRKSILAVPGKSRSASLFLLSCIRA